MTRRAALVQACKELDFTVLAQQRASQNANTLRQTDERFVISAVIDMLRQTPTVLELPKRAESRWPFIQYVSANDLHLYSRKTGLRERVEKTKQLHETRIAREDEWSENEIAYLWMLHASKRTNIQISSALGRSVSAVRSKLYHCGMRRDTDDVQVFS